MPVSAELLQDFDDLAASLGPTPVLDDRGIIVPIGEPEGGKKAVYVVWVGRAVGLFHNWGLACAMITGFSGASFKGYPNVERARSAWYQGPTAFNGPWRPPAPREAILTSTSRPPPARGPSVASAPTTPGSMHVLPPEISVDVPPRIPAALHHSDSDEELWGDDIYYTQPPELDNADPSDVLSPTISGISSLSLSDASPSLSSGAVSPGPLLNSLLPLTTISETGPANRPMRIPIPTSPVSLLARPLAEPGGSAYSPRHPAKPPRSQRPSTLIASRDSTPRSSSRSTRSSSSTSGRHRSATSSGRPSSAASLTSPRSASEESGISSVAVQKPKEVFVVVRGDQPGIYFDRETALFMLGSKLGMKVVVFHSLRKATAFFTKEYMARKVGVPVLVAGSRGREELVDGEYV